MITSLYIHIPFCSNKCHYCDFTSFSNKEIEQDKYVDLLIEELLFKKKEYHLSNLNTIYIGGGTPTVLPLFSLNKILLSIKENFNFSDDYEFTIEGNPESITQEKLALMRKYGVNRLSMGVQSFQDKTLTFLGRTHSTREVEKAYMDAREAGFENISMDLIYGISEETFESWQDTLKKTVALQPKHISIYQLKIEEDTPLYQRLLKGEIENFPDEIAEKIYLWNLKYLEENKFSNYEFSNFARKEKYSKHNLNYWNYLPYAAVGFGGIGFYGNYRSEFKGNFKEYMQVTDFQSNNFLIEEVTKQEKITEYIIMNLRKNEGFSLTDFQDRFNVSFLQIYSKQVKKIINEKHLEISNDRAFLTLKGRLISNLILEEFV